MHKYDPLFQGYSCSTQHISVTSANRGCQTELLTQIKYAFWFVFLVMDTNGPTELMVIEKVFLIGLTHKNVNGMKSSFSRATVLL